MFYLVSRWLQTSARKAEITCEAETDVFWVRYWSNHHENPHYALSLAHTILLPSGCQRIKVVKFGLPPTCNGSISILTFAPAQLFSLFSSSSFFDLCSLSLPHQLLASSAALYRRHLFPSQSPISLVL